jgi:precorrin-2 methylase
MVIGTLYGISVGSGDPELITLKGWRCLQQVPVVAFPAGVEGKPGYAQQTVTQWLQPQQVQLALTFPYVLGHGSTNSSLANCSPTSLAIFCSRQRCCFCV